MKKYVIIIIAAVLILTVATIFFVRNILHKQEPGYSEMIRDSLVIIEKKLQIHHDSTVFWDEQHTIFEAKNDSVNRLDSIGRAALRNFYRAKVEADIAGEIRTGAAR